MAQTSVDNPNDTFRLRLPPDDTYSYIGTGTSSEFLFSDQGPDLDLHTWEIQSCLQIPGSPSDTEPRQSHMLCFGPYLDTPVPVSTDGFPVSVCSGTASAQDQQKGLSEPSPVIASRSGDIEDCVSLSLDYGSCLATHPASTNCGRKRPRVPHTAVERRYRDKFNAHIERLRQTVPVLASGCGRGGLHLPGPGLQSIIRQNSHRPNTAPPVQSLPNGARPSKSEILIGAIKYIHAVELENVAAREEIEDLKFRLRDLDNWYSIALHDLSEKRGLRFAG